MRPLPIEPLAGTPASVLGMAIVRGAPIPVVDARRVFGEPSGEPSRWVSVRTGPRVVALAVDSVIGVRTIERASLGELPPLFADAAAGALAAVGALDSELILVLEAIRLIPDELAGGVA